jgi:hypothetical protein
MHFFKKKKKGNDRHTLLTDVIEILPLISKFYVPFEQKSVKKISTIY